MKTLPLSLLMLCLGGAAVAQPPIYPVKDINSVQTGGTWLWPYNAEFVAMNGAAYFVVSDGVHGLELWRSDGTEAGTRLVKDINPGAASGVPRWLTAVGTTLYFSADDGAHGPELWKSDGTEAGTVLIADIVPGLAGSSPTYLFEFGGALYFSADQQPAGRELWTSDGTGAGTALVKDLQPGADGSEPQPLARVGGIQFLSAWDSVHGRELWRTDGTADGTVLIKDINPGAVSSHFYQNPPLSGYAELAVFGGRLFFNALEPGTGSELWASDGTEAGTVLIKDIAPGLFSSQPFSLVPFGGQLLFRANDNTHGNEIWKSDGTEAGTVQVKDILPGENGSAPWELTPFGPWVYFRANDGTHGSELWRTDGTEANTVLAADIQPGAPSGIPFFGPAGFQEAGYGASLVFFADDGVHGLEPWYTDGSTTAILADLNPAGPSMYQLHPVNNDRRLVLNGLWYFRAFDSAGDVEVYLSNGTPAGTGKLEEINDQASAFELSFVGIPFGASTLADRNGTLFFQASDGVDGSELWKSDGTAAGTQEVADIFPGPVGSAPYEITALGNSVVFGAENDFATGRELWISDGTAAGTSLLEDLEPTGSTSGGSPWWLTRVGSLVFLNGFDGTSEKLWQTDGTPGGTVPARLAAPTATGPTELTALAGLLLYNGQGSDGAELWRTNGTEAGTFQVADIAPGVASSSPDRLTVAGSHVFFSAEEPAAGRELWVSDGTGAGTHRVKDIIPGAGSGILPTVDDTAFRLEHWAAAGSRIFFQAGDSTTGEELWVSDGTDVGTHLVLDILPGARSSEIRGLTAVAGRVFFAADDGVHGRELWMSDGTAAGTRMIFDLVPGAGSSLPEQLLAVNQSLLFSAWRTSEGRELWTVDRDGLFMKVLTDIAPGGESSSPQELTVSGSRLHFVATDGSTGYELYSIPVSAVDGGFDYYPVTPCRLVDTRQTGGALVSGTPRRVQAAGPCGIPGDARALAVTVTVINPTASGNLLLYRGATDPTPTSTVNFVAGVNRTNNAIVEIGLGGINASATLSGGGQVDVVVDVSGYFQ